MNSSWRYKCFNGRWSINSQSQFLHYILWISPNAINTTGRGSTGVCLTTAVVVDRDTGDRHLETGAMILGDRVIVCID